MGTSIDIGILDTTIVVLYFLVVVALGTAMGGFTRSTKDFFLAGQRFSSWFIAFSCVATTVGSYSFIKYAEQGFKTGISSSMSYLNDWIWYPLWVFGWLPIVYYSRVVSIPEYFERRFNAQCRAVMSAILLLYMVGYIGINLYTLGVALEPILLAPLQKILPWAGTFHLVIFVAFFTSIYVVAGGQTSVIVTDLVQGCLLLFLGLALFAGGLSYMHAHGAGFWANLPPLARVPIYQLREPGDFNSLGVFWQDGVANSAAFWFINQGLILRFLSARSVREGRRAFTLTLLILMPVAALCTSGAGWLGRAMVEAGLLPRDVDSKYIFVTVAREVMHTPGFFGLVLAALTAALMSTADTLINAVAAVSVNDIYRRFMVRDRPDRHYLAMARWISIAAAIVGVAIVPVYMRYKSIYVAHGAFTAAITPPLVVAVLLAAFWRRYTNAAAMATMVGGTALIWLSSKYPQMMEFCRLGIAPGGELYFRALFGMLVCLAIGIGTSLFTKHHHEEEMDKLTWGSETAFRERFKGGPLNDQDPGERITLRVEPLPGAAADDGRDEVVERVYLDPDSVRRTASRPGDILYMTSLRWWYGGLCSSHCRLGAPEPARAAAGGGPPAGTLWAHPELLRRASVKAGQEVRVWKLM